MAAAAAASSEAAAVVRRAVAAAQAAQQEWRALSGATRGRVLGRVAAGLRGTSARSFAEQEAAQTNVALRETAEAHVPGAAACVEYFAGRAATALEGTHQCLPGEGASPYSFGLTRREPLGVVGAITAWNYPLLLASWKVAPALACGNTVVIKPSELTPATTHALSALVAEAAAAEGVSAAAAAGLVCVVDGAGEVGQSLCAAEGVAKVSFTGGQIAGRAVAAACAAGLKPATLELGGKSPLLVFADADMGVAADAVVAANFSNSGQVCSNGTRVFVERAAVAGLTGELLPRLAAVRLGLPLDEATEMGPLVSQQHYERVRRFVEEAAEDEACRVVTPAPFDSWSAVHPWMVGPTVVVCDSDEPRVVREEVFGPVACVLPFDTEAEAIERANATPYGLCAGVVTASLDRAHRVVAQLDAGTTFVNTYNVCPPELPFGGFKASGYGKELSSNAIAHYTRVKSCFVDVRAS